MGKVTLYQLIYARAGGAATLAIGGSVRRQSLRSELRAPRRRFLRHAWAGAQLDSRSAELLLDRLELDIVARKAREGGAFPVRIHWLQTTEAQEGWHTGRGSPRSFWQP